MVGVQEVIHTKKIIKKFKKKCLPPFYKRNGFLNFFRHLFSTLYNIYLIIKIGWVVFEKIKFFDFSKFVHNFCKKIFFELILGLNLSCNGSHLPLQYGSIPNGGTQTMLILLRPLFLLPNPFSEQLENLSSNLNNVTMYKDWHKSQIDPNFHIYRILAANWLIDLHEISQPFLSLLAQHTEAVTHAATNL